MKRLKETLEAHLKEAAANAFGQKLKDVEATVVPASNAAFGDYQSNLAMTLSRELKLNPRAIAEQIVAKFNAGDFCEPPSVAGPGFINLTIKTSYLEAQLNSIRFDTRLGVPVASPRKKVIVDMSSPNIAKEMHVGHLRSTIIGESLARTYEFLGHEVMRVNHVGDWGTQFGMLIAELKITYPQALTDANALNLGDLVTFYKQAKKHFDEDTEFQTTARSEVVKLQSGEEQSLVAWRLLCDQSRKAFEEVYDLLDVRNLREKGESFYNPMLPGVVADLEKSGLLVEDEGARCVFLEGFLNEEGKPLPMIVQKKDGGFNYATTDLACIRFRVEVERVDESIYVVDAGQAPHFAQLFQVARKAGWLPPGVRFDHVPFGVVQGEDGKKLKTRSGETVRLQDLLDEAITTARAELDARLNEDGKEETEEFKQSVAKAIGLGAVKYADLSLNRMTNYVFSFKRMLSLQGNTAPYMMYAFVRVQGICRKGGIDFDNIASESRIQLKHETEIELAKHILRLDESLEAVLQDFLPNRICEYLFELAQRFNKFYDTCPVLDTEEPDRTSRLLMCALTARALKTGLNLLGIATIDRM